MVRALESADIDVTILSSALTSGGSLKWFPTTNGGRISKSWIFYCGVLRAPVFNTFTSILSIYKQIKRMQKEERIDAILFYNFKPEAAWPAFFASKRYHIPIVVEYEDGYKHVKEMSWLKRKVFLLTETTVKKRIKKAIIANSLMKSEFPTPCFVLRGIVNPTFHHRCKTYMKCRNERFTILYSGGLDPSRGVQILLKSLEYLKIPCEVQITGKGELNSADERVQVLGFLPYDQVLARMMQADLLVQCQLVNDQFASVSFPSKLFEYIATGNSVVSSSLPDVVDFGANRLSYYNNDDPKELAERIMEVFHQWEAGLDHNHKTTDLCEDNLPEAIGERLAAFLDEI